MILASLARSNNMYFPKIYNIEMDPHEDLNIGGVSIFIVGPAYQAIQARSRSKSIQFRPRPI